MTSTIVKRSIVLGGNKTSVSLEDEFWKGLQAIADREQISVSKLAERINLGRRDTNLSSAIRVFVYNFACAHGCAERENSPVRPGVALSGAPLAG